MAVFRTEHAFEDRQAKAPGQGSAGPASGFHRRDPDEEALEIAARVVARLEVAKSLARLAGTALRAQLGTVESAARVERFARAAMASAKHVAREAVARHMGSRVAEPEPLDPIASHDDPC